MAVLVAVMEMQKYNAMIWFNTVSGLFLICQLLGFLDIIWYLQERKAVRSRNLIPPRVCTNFQPGCGKTIWCNVLKACWNNGPGVDFLYCRWMNDLFPHHVSFVAKSWPSRSEHNGPCGELKIGPRHIGSDIFELRWTYSIDKEASARKWTVHTLLEQCKSSLHHHPIQHGAVFNIWPPNYTCHCGHLIATDFYGLGEASNI